MKSDPKDTCFARGFSELVVVGGGLAGCEAAWAIARQGLRVRLYEMRPHVKTPAHETGLLAELVCSNSLGANQTDRATGLLQAEARRLGSLLLPLADRCAVSAGGALAVDRNAFSSLVTAALEAEPLITIVRAEQTTLPPSETISVIATGPLTSQAFADQLAAFANAEHLFFYDALAPIVRADSIDLNIAFLASRYEMDPNKPGAYLNCPLNRLEYDRFVAALLTAKRAPLRSFEEGLVRGVRTGATPHFEGCLPIEVLAERGPETLAFGPMRPVGIRNPGTQSRPHAIVQLRQDDLAASNWNLVGFQTNLTYGEQERVFRLIPGLEQAVFIRYGQMHRNTYLCAPRLLESTLACRLCPTLFFAGQLAGIEGYVGSIATGLLAGHNAAALVLGRPPLDLPPTTMLGALTHYLAGADSRHFQPMKANFGLLSPLPPDITPPGRPARYAAYATRSLAQIPLACSP